MHQQRHARAPAAGWFAPIPCDLRRIEWAEIDALAILGLDPAPVRSILFSNATDMDCSGPDWNGSQCLACRRWLRGFHRWALEGWRGQVGRASKLGRQSWRPRRSGHWRRGRHRWNSYRWRRWKRGGRRRGRWRPGCSSSRRHTGANRRRRRKRIRSGGCRWIEHGCCNQHWWRHRRRDEQGWCWGQSGCWRRIGWRWSGRRVRRADLHVQRQDLSLRHDVAVDRRVSRVLVPGTQWRL